MRVLKLGKTLYVWGRTWDDVLIITEEVGKLVNKELINADSSVQIGNLIINLKKSKPIKLQVVLKLDVVEKTPKAKLTTSIFIKLLKRKVLK